MIVERKIGEMNNRSITRWAGREKRKKKRKKKKEKNERKERKAGRSTASRNSDPVHPLKKSRMEKRLVKKRD